MSTFEEGTRNFLESMGAELYGNQARNWVMNFRDSVLGLTRPNPVYPLRVAKIIDTPMGPTGFQDSLKGVIVPNYKTIENDSRILVGAPQAFLNAVILYLYDFFKRGDYESAYGVVQYLRWFELNPIPNADLWSLSSESGRGFLEHGILDEAYAEDPYTYSERVFNFKNQ